MKQDKELSATKASEQEGDTTQSQAFDIEPSFQSLFQYFDQLFLTHGYELVDLEIQNHRENTLRVYIDSPKGITLEDCVKVNDLLEAPLETLPEVKALFGDQSYELEVSSPGIERPLRKPTDFERFKFTLGRIQTFRALLGHESLNPEYSSKNPKQKNYFGVIRGFDTEKNAVLLGVLPEDGTLNSKTQAKGQKKKLSPNEKMRAEMTKGLLKNEKLVYIPRSLIVKAHLEPRSP